MKVRYVPNELAKAMFDLQCEYIEHDGCTPCLVAAIGQSNYDRYMIAQDPFCGGVTKASVRIIANPDERVPELMEFVSIGTIEKVP